MASDALEGARSRYTAAYAVYDDASKRVTQKLEGGRSPSAEEIGDEAKAIEQLADARRELLDVMSRLMPLRH
jgi:hypothetical protein